MNPPTCLLDGFGPLPCVRPESVAALGDLIRRAGAQREAVYPVGGQTKVSLGATPNQPGTVVDLRGLAQVIDFPARDMTVTVQAGITIKALQEILAKEKLRLPIEVAHADRATLGGILATNASGPRRLGYGTLRDYVIGISAVNDEGKEFKAGGRVVKNVAGYDLCKLLVGSLGTLGVITQATLKLRPLAEQQALVSLPCEAAELEALLQRLHESRSRPVCVELLNRAAAAIVYPRAELVAAETPWTIVVGYEGNADAVAWEAAQLVKEIGPRSRIDARVDYTANALWDSLIELSAHGEMTFKANMLPSAVAWFCQDIDQDVALRAHAQSGIVHGHCPAALTKEEAATMLKVWRDRAKHVFVTNCRSEWKSAIDVWGPAPEAIGLMREVKAKFDPKGIFNPGRFVGGI